MENKTIFGSFIKIIPTHFRNTILYIEIVILLNKNTKVESSVCVHAGLTSMIHESLGVC